MGIKDDVLGIFLTNSCPVCGKTIRFNDNSICKECENDIKYVAEPRCRKCGRPLHDLEQLFCDECTKKKHQFEQGICVFEHSGEIKKAIYEFKYANRRECGEFFGREAAKRYAGVFREWNIDVMVPVPIHKSREIKRGYNQALEFAQAVSKYTHIPINDKLIIRIKKTAPQKELTEVMRYLNLKDAFAINIEKMQGVNNILIVDDIYTTGSTIDTCSTILKKAGAKKVYFLCISAGVGV